VIYNASHTLNELYMNYTVTKKEFLAMAFASEKFKPYLISFHVIVFTNHVRLKHLLSKRDAKPMLVRSMLLLPEFDYEIRDMKGFENVVSNHLSMIACDKSTKAPISKCLPDEKLFVVHSDPWYADIVN